MRVLTAAVVAALLLATSAPVGAAQSDVDAAQRKANQAAAALSAAMSEAEELAEEVARLETEVAAAEASLEGLRQRVRTLAVEEYMAGSSAGSATPLTGNIADATKADTLAELAMSQSSDDVERYRQASGELADQRAVLAERKAAQEAAVAGLRTAQTKAFDELAKVQKAESDRKAKEAADAAAAERARQQAAQQQQASRRTTTNAPAPAVNVAVDWVCPVQGGRSFSNDFGAPRSGHSHQGNDVFATTGTPIVAPVAGTVRDYSSGSGGNGFALDGVDGNTYVGYHMNTRLVVTGSVAKGTLIGYVGSTGNASAPHLHFEIHPGGGGAVNPYSTLSRYC